MITVGLVVLVIFVFLRSIYATIIPSVAVPLSLVGTFAVMYMLGYSLDNLSLMALTISTGTRIYSQQLLSQQAAVNSAQQLLDLEVGRYETGIDPYIDVVTAQTTLLTDQQALATVHIDLMVSAVDLIEALGGGWDASQLPTPSQVSQKTSSADYKQQQ
jgi:hypothetical protein